FERVGVDEDRPGPAILTEEERGELVALVRVGAIVEEGDRLPAALVDRARPRGEDRAREPVETDAVAVALLDHPRPAALAEAGRRPRVVVAGTAVVAVARDQHGPLQRPRHDQEPRRGGDQGVRFNRIETDVDLTIATSSLRSPSKSPSATDRGPSPFFERPVL